MTVTVRPATRFDDVAALVGPKRPDANVCWCLSYRLTSSAENRALVGQARGARVAELMSHGPPGVIAYLPGTEQQEPERAVGWAAVHPRVDTSFARNRKIPHVGAPDDPGVWCVWCIRVRPGHRGEGLSHALLAGAVDFARDAGAQSIEGYPVDNRGEKVDLTMAYVGTKALFERAGFTQAAETSSVLNGFPRVLMRRALT